MRTKKIVKSTRQKQSRQSSRNEYFEEDFVPAVTRRTVPKLVAKTENQKKYISAITNFRVVYGIGPAGTGKTYASTMLACQALADRNIDKIVLTRPAVEAGERLGFLPGELDQKYAPYLAPVIEYMNDYFGKSHVENLIKLGKIEAIPLGFMRGRTFRNCMVLVDEAQNITKEQMKMLLTRIGEGCTMVIDGDPTQADIHNSGLMDSVKRISYIPSVKVVAFTKQDVVRDPLVAEILDAYDLHPDNQSST